MGALSSAVLDTASGATHERYSELSEGHAEGLLPMIAEVMAEAGLYASALDRIVVTIGPGTFTGTRTGLAAARGMSIAVGVPVVGLSSLAAIAASGPENAVVAMDARRGELFFQIPGSDRGPELLSINAAVSQLLALGGRAICVIGTGAAALIDACRDAGLTITAASRHVAGPRASDFVFLGEHLPLSSRPPSPLYLREPDAKPPGALADILVQPGFTV